MLQLNVLSETSPLPHSLPSPTLSPLSCLDRYEEIFHNPLDYDSSGSIQQTSLFDSPSVDVPSSPPSEVYAASFHAIIYGKAPASTIRSEELSRMGSTSTTNTPIKGDTRHILHNNGISLQQTWSVVDIQVWQ